MFVDNSPLYKALHFFPSMALDFQVALIGLPQWGRCQQGYKLGQDNAPKKCQALFSYDCILSIMFDKRCIQNIKGCSKIAKSSNIITCLPLPWGMCTTGWHNILFEPEVSLSRWEICQCRCLQSLSCSMHWTWCWRVWQSAGPQRWQLHLTTDAQKWYITKKCGHGFIWHDMQSNSRYMPLVTLVLM